MRLVVTGGRDYKDTVRIFAALDEFHSRHPVTTVIEGEAEGLDSRARVWARRKGLDVASFPTDWDDISHPSAVIRYTRGGKAYDVTAGLRRNQQMINEGKPDFALVFPGGSGTADMKARIIAAGISYEEVAA